MARTQRILVLAFVATALAADRAGAAVPMLRPNGVAVAARQLAGRLVVGFRHVVAAVRHEPLRQNERPADSTAPGDFFNRCLPEHPFAFSPFQFRLPPPAV